MTDLWGIVIPIVVSVILSLAAAAIVSRSAASPAQAAYIQALQGRLAVVEDERDDAQLRLPKLEARIAALESQVNELKSALHEKDAELARLYRRLDADERRLPR